MNNQNVTFIFDTRFSSYSSSKVCKEVKIRDLKVLFNKCSVVVIDENYQSNEETETVRTFVSLNSFLKNIEKEKLDVIYYLKLDSDLYLEPGNQFEYFVENLTRDFTNKVNRILDYYNPGVCAVTANRFPLKFIKLRKRIKKVLVINRAFKGSSGLVNGLVNSILFFRSQILSDALVTYLGFQKFVDRYVPFVNTKEFDPSYKQIAIITLDCNIKDSTKTNFITNDGMNIEYCSEKQPIPDFCYEKIFINKLNALSYFEIIFKNRSFFMMVASLLFIIFSIFVTRYSDKVSEIEEFLKYFIVYLLSKLPSVTAKPKDFLDPIKAILSVGLSKSLFFRVIYGYFGRIGRRECLEIKYEDIRGWIVMLRYLLFFVFPYYDIISISIMFITLTAFDWSLKIITKSLSILRIDFWKRDKDEKKK